MGPRRTRVRVLMFLLLVMMMAVGANRDSTAAGFGRTMSKAEVLASPPQIPPDGNPDIVIRNRVVLSIANVFSVAVSLWPLFVRWRYGSWFITRQIFPAKVVACNLVASVTWTIYMMVQIYAGGNYAGDDVLLINSVSTTSSMFILLVYFLHGREDIKYWILMILFAIVVCCGMGWLVWHPNIIVSKRTQNLLKKPTQQAGVTGIVLFGLMNFLPLVDLVSLIYCLAMECVVLVGHDRRDFSLHTPMIINTTLSCLSSAFWALYAWLFDPKTPNYFMIANSLAAAMNLIQIVWLLIPRNCHREVVGQIADVESLRSVLLSVARSLERLGAAAPTEEFLTQTKYLLRLKKGMSIGWQSLAVMEIAFIQMEENLREKVTVTAAALAAAQGVQEIHIARSADERASNAVRACRSLHEECKVSKEAFGEIQREIKNKIANVPGSGENLQINIKATAERTRNLARSVRANMETINGQEGIFPPTMKIAFNFCTEQILAVKSSADAPFLWLGFGGFALRRRLKLSFDKVNWPAVPFLGY